MIPVEVETKRTLLLKVSAMNKFPSVSPYKKEGVLRVAEVA
jgi:hypothetical protein